MKLCNLFRVGYMLLLATVITPSAVGQSILEDFEDGDYRDGTPASWGRYTAPFDKGDVIIQNGSLVITPPITGTPHPGIPNAWETDVFLRNHLYHDVNLLTQVRALSDSPTAIGINAIDSDATDYPDGSGVYALIVNDGARQFLDLSYGIGDSGQTWSQVDTDLNLFETEVSMRLTIQDRKVAFTAWAVGTPEPQPQIVGFLPTILQHHQGYMGLYSIGRSQPAPAAFRYVTIVPEPTGGLLYVLGIGLVVARRCRR